jgi:hypothetical protein
VLVAAAEPTATGGVPVKRVVRDLELRPLTGVHGDQHVVEHPRLRRSGEQADGVKEDDAHEALVRRLDCLP